MVDIVASNVTLDPIDMAPLGPAAIVARTQRLAHLGEVPGFCGTLICDTRRGVASLNLNMRVYGLQHNAASVLKDRFAPYGAPSLEWFIDNLAENVSPRHKQ